MAQLTCQNLRVGYDGKSVLQDLSFEVFAGDYLCIVGENGVDLQDCGTPQRGQDCRGSHQAHPVHKRFQLY